MTETSTEVKFSSSQVLETKCGECRLLCSVAPVSEESGSFYCGRCRPMGTPNRLFEEAAKKVLFPCTFQCGIKNVWGHTLQHEVCCTYRDIVCPHVNCKSTISLRDLQSHMKECHRTYCQEVPTYQVNIGYLEMIDRLHYIAFDKFHFLFFAKLERSAAIINFNYNLCLVWPQSYEQTELDKLELRLVIEIPRPHLTITALIDNNTILDYDDRSHCVNCLYRNCDKFRHKNKCNWTIHNIQLDGKGSSRNLFYTIAVSKKVTVSRNVPDSLQCPVCTNYMMEQIYLCERGHSLCGNCKQYNIICPLCRGNMLNIRNYSMENLTKQINVPCRKELTGCKFVGVIADVMVHEKSCKYA